MNDVMSFEPAPGNRDDEVPKNLPTGLSIATGREV